MDTTQKPLYESADEEFRVNTGRDLGTWFNILRTWNALNKGHTLMVDHLQKVYGISADWAQAIAVRYQKETYLPNM